MIFIMEAIGFAFALAPAFALKLAFGEMAEWTLLASQRVMPTVLAGFDQHSSYREDPESRLVRTASFVTITTFGTTDTSRKNTIATHTTNSITG